MLKTPPALIPGGTTTAIIGCAIAVGTAVVADFGIESEVAQSTPVHSL